MTACLRNLLCWFICFLFIGTISSTLWAEDAPKQQADAAPKQPRIVGDWWQVAGSPDLGELTSEHQQPVDFAVWQAADGTWQLWSCIRNTKEPGKTRLFYRWEGKNLTDKNWTPMGIALRAAPSVGERQGGLQAPFVFKPDGLYWMFYGDWANICLATGKDGKTFERRLNADGKSALFSNGINTRDPMVIKIGDLWHCYYTAWVDYPDEQNPGKHISKGKIFCRTSADLKAWSEPKIVCAGGSAGSGPLQAECPFVVEESPGNFYLFRNQKYGGKGGNTVYFSHDPLDFGIDNDEGHLVCKLPVSAPEIIKHDGQYYIAALMPDLKGIRIARLEWVAAK